MAAMKGLYSTWDRLGNLSAIIVLLQNIKKQVNKSLGNHQGNTHTTPDTSDIVWKVADSIRDLTLDRDNVTREGNRSAKKKVNTKAKGEKLLKSTTLATFNKKVRRMNQGFDDHEDELDVDEIPANDVSLSTGDV